MGKGHTSTRKEESWGGDESKLSSRYGIEVHHLTETYASLSTTGAGTGTKPPIEKTTTSGNESDVAL